MRYFLGVVLTISTLIITLEALVQLNPLMVPNGPLFVGLLIVTVLMDYIYNPNSERFSDQVFFPLLLERGLGVATLFSIIHKLITKFLFNISSREKENWPFWVSVGIRITSGSLALYVNDYWETLNFGELTSIVALIVAYAVYVVGIAAFETLWRYAIFGQLRFDVPDNWVSNLAVFLVFILMVNNGSPVAGYLFILLSYAINQKKSTVILKAGETDFLTQIPNRRAWDKKIKELMVPDGRFGVLFLDIDNFKQVNDTYGHGMGDEVLKAVTQAIKKLVRKEDFVARYGGEEFAVLLIDAEKEVLTQRAEEIRVGVEKTVITAYGHQVKVTVSIGGALYPDDGVVAGELMRKADERLYLAKEGGKNRAVLTAN